MIYAAFALLIHLLCIWCVVYHAWKAYKLQKSDPIDALLHLGFAILFATVV